MKHPNLIDGRRIYNPKEFSHKLKFEAIGLALKYRTAAEAGKATSKTCS